LGKKDGNAQESGFSTKNSTGAPLYVSKLLMGFDGTEKFQDLLNYFSQQEKEHMYSNIDPHGVLTKKTLEWLLSQYLENPEGTFDICEALAEAGISDIRQIHELGAVLVSKGFVKGHVFGPAGFSCRITTLGISQVENFFSELRFQVLQGSIRDQKKSLVDILSAKPGHFTKVQDFAKYLKKTGMIECVFFPADVMAVPTSSGKSWYEGRRAQFTLPG